MIAALLAAAATWLLVAAGPKSEAGATGSRLSSSHRTGLRDAALVMATWMSLGPIAAAGAALVLRAVLPRLVVVEVSHAVLDVDDVITASDYLSVCATAGLTTGESLTRLAGAESGMASQWATEVIARHHAGMPLGSALEADGHESARELSRVLIRSHTTGAPVAGRLRRQSQTLRRERRDLSLQRVRSLGVRAVAPLGLCFLPAFILLAVVPLAASFATQLSW